jgi:hypothetical protein
MKGENTMQVNVREFNTEASALVKVSIAAIPTMSELASPDSIKRLRAFIKPNIEQALAVRVKDAGSKSEAYLWAGTLKPFSVTLDTARREINATLKAEVDGRLQPTITEIDCAVKHCENELRTYDTEQLRAAQEAQRKADEERAKEQAELERRRKIQEAAVAAGKEKRTEIPIEAPRVEIAKPVGIAADKRSHYRVRYEVLDVEKLPEGFYVKEANKTAINEKALAIEGRYEKARKGIDEIPQEVPGVRFFWDAQYRMV